MKYLLAILMLCSMPARANDYLEPALIGLATVAVMRTPALNNRCNDEPCNTLSHIAVGAASGWYVKKKYGIGPALLSGLVIGVGKELADKHFDTKDALATMLGSVIVVSIDF